MSKITKIVEVGSVQTKSGQTGDRKWRRYSLIDPDDRFVASTFSGTVGKFLQEHEGQRVEVDIEERAGTEGGTLRDLLEAREVSSKDSPADSNGSGPSVPAQARHSAIVREVAIKAAVEVAELLEAKDVEAIIVVAGKFEAFINGENGAEDPSK